MVEPDGTGINSRFQVGKGFAVRRGDEYCCFFVLSFQLCRVFEGKRGFGLSPCGDGDALGCHHLWGCNDGIIYTGLAQISCKSFSDGRGFEYVTSREKNVGLQV